MPRRQVPEEEKKITEPFTSRIEKQVLEKLRDEATQKDQSLNSLVSQIFRQYVDWHNNAAKAGFTSVRRGLVIKMIDKLSEKDVIEIAEYVAKNESRSFIFLLRNQYNITSAIDVLETWIKIAGYPYRHDVQYGHHSFLIHHEMGKKWSLYLQTQYELIFQSFGITMYDKEMDDNMLAFKFDLV